MQLFDAVQLTHHYLLPCRNTQGILYHISKCRISRDENPIKVCIEYLKHLCQTIVHVINSILLQHYFEKGYAPRIIHYVSITEEPKAPKDQAIESLPLRWRIYLSKVNTAIIIVFISN